MRVQLQAAYVLHRRPFRDTSMLLDVFTAEYGLLSLVARGLNRRRHGGSLNSLLQPFKPLLLSFSGRGELLSLGSAESAGELSPLLGDAMLSGFYLNELLLRLLHRFVAQPQVFRAYATVLAELASKAHIEPALRRFEFTLLEELGYAVELESDALTGEPIVSQAMYTLVPELGLRRSKVSSDGSRGVDFSGEALLRIARGDYGGSAASAAKRLVRTLLQPHLGSEPLRTRSMFASRPASAAVPASRADG
ncbi:MAG: DNA repair protein RecO [Congregibacter sp.]